MECPNGARASVSLKFQNLQDSRWIKILLCLFNLGSIQSLILRNLVLHSAWVRWLECRMALLDSRSLSAITFLTWVTGISSKLEDEGAETNALASVAAALEVAAGVKFSISEATIRPAGPDPCPIWLISIPFSKAIFLA